MTVKGQFEQAAPAVLLKAVSGNKLAVEIVHCPQPHTPFPLARLVSGEHPAAVMYPGVQTVTGKEDGPVQTCSVLAGPIMHAFFCFVPSFVLLG